MFTAVDLGAGFGGLNEVKSLWAGNSDASVSSLDEVFAALDLVALSVTLSEGVSIFAGDSEALALDESVVGWALETLSLDEFVGWWAASSDTGASSQRVVVLTLGESAHAFLGVVGVVLWAGDLGALLGQLVNGVTLLTAGSDAAFLGESISLLTVLAFALELVGARLDVSALALLDAQLDSFVDGEGVTSWTGDSDALSSDDLVVLVALDLLALSFGIESVTRLALLGDAGGSDEFFSDSALESDTLVSLSDFLLVTDD